MDELKDVILNVYTLATDSPELGRTASFVSRMLPSLGLGAYHTSLEIDGSHYTFAAGSGIVKTSNRYSQPPVQASFREAIPLGSCRVSSRNHNGHTLASILSILGEKFFTPTAYHLVHRNCNHFTETLATALILHDEILAHAVATSKRTTPRLTTFPDWINRLASTGAMVIHHDADIVPCRVWYEASVALGAQSVTPSPVAIQPAASRTQKKTLTEAQKKILAKMQKK